MAGSQGEKSLNVQFILAVANRRDRLGRPVGRRAVEAAPGGLIASYS
jgi:hypothetical protein